MEESTPVRAADRLGMVWKERPSRARVGIHEALPWEAWARVLKMRRDDSALLKDFDTPRQAQAAKVCKPARAAFGPGFELHVVTNKETGRGELYGVYTGDVDDD